MLERLRIIRNRAFLRPQIREAGRTLAETKANKENHNNKSWYEFPKSRETNLQDKALSQKTDRANSNYSNLIKHKDFRLNVLKSIPVIGVATGLLAIGLRFIV